MKDAPWQKCPVCGVSFSAVPGPGKCQPQLAWHIGCNHSPKASPTGRVFGCFCGQDHTDNIHEHIMENGGYEAHYMDFLMGVTHGQKETT